MYLYRCILPIIAILLTSYLFIKVLAPPWEDFIKPKISEQEKVEHTIYFLDDSLEEHERCTSTVIAPHAVLTAEHCKQSKKGLVGTYLRFDSSTRVYIIRGEVYDYRDHAIYVLDGPVFQHVLPESSLLDAKTDDGEYTIYGSSSGKSTGPLNVKWRAKSDVDEAQGLHRFNIPILPGDSGAAIFDRDGKVVGLVTYQNGVDQMSGFSLDFSKSVLDFVQTVK